MLGVSRGEGIPAQADIVIYSNDLQGFEVCTIAKGADKALKGARGVLNEALRVWEG